MSIPVNKSNDQPIDYYDDKKHNYQDFWVGRDYEHESEVIALRRLLKGKHFVKAMDYGGGYGRISPIILEFSEQLSLVEPSTKQLNIAKDFLKSFPNVEFVKITKSDYVPAEDNSINLLVMVRVSHHLPDPTNTFKEIYRVLSPGGEAIIEIANEAHFVNRLRYLKKLQSVPKQSIPIGQKANGKQEDTPFFNHNPATIAKLLTDNKLNIVDKLSVSNLRSQYLKTRLSPQLMLSGEKLAQKNLAFLNFGPSIFFLVRKDQ